MIRIVSTSGRTIEYPNAQFVVYEDDHWDLYDGDPDEDDNANWIASLVPQNVIAVDSVDDEVTDTFESLGIN